VATITNIDMSRLSRAVIRLPPEVLSRDEADRLLAACGRSRTGKRNRAPAVLEHGGFARRGGTVTGESRYKKLEAVELLRQPGGFEGLGVAQEVLRGDDLPASERS
jgi:hypothetical protein